MTHTKYHFVTTFTLAAPLPQVWDVILDYQQWPVWWKGVKKISVIPTKKASKDKQLVCHIGFPFYTLYCTLTLDKVVEHNMIHILSHRDLEGIGVFTFAEKNAATTVTFTWDVKTTKFWMNLVAPLAKPIFIHSHYLVMNWFAKGLAKHLHTTLLSLSHT